MDDSPQVLKVGTVRRAPVRLGTKAETLTALRPLLRHSQVCDLVYFTVEDWEQRATHCIATIRSTLAVRWVIVRSSAIGEDSANQSMAGCFTSILDVDASSDVALERAISAVIDSYGPTRSDHQILVQPMLHRASLVGVVMTHDLDTGAPYYVINYDDESGRTDTVTGGLGVNKTVMVLRSDGPQRVESPRVKVVLKAVQEVEALCGPRSLDIEVAVDDQNTVSLLQVRPIATQSRWHPGVEADVHRGLAEIQALLVERVGRRPGVFGTRPVYAMMSDWNPAEMIGERPRPLAFSLYERLITRTTWRTARARMGYHDPAGESLMFLLGHQPFIDVRNSFSSFIPQGLPSSIGDRLVEAWLDRLRAHPELHDKVEFEVATTSLDFSFHETLRSRYPHLLSRDDAETWRVALRDLTRSVVRSVDGDGAFAWALDQAAQLERSQEGLEARCQAFISGRSEISGVLTLLDECQRLGTEPFAVAARSAFIAEAFLRSLQARGAVSSDDVAALKRSWVTVAGTLAKEVAAVRSGERTADTFIEHFGHLRPGTYDVRSLRYADMPGLIEALTHAPEGHLVSKPVDLGVRVKADIDALLREAGLELDAGTLLQFAERAIVARESLKFVFSKHVSAALELLVHWGARHGAGREDLSLLTLNQLQSLDTASDTTALREAVGAAREREARSGAVRLSYIVRDEDDIFVIPLHRSSPNFITRKSVRGHVVSLTGAETDLPDVNGKIACIENADPGFDWIFSQRLAGLITKYGGANSHMAIRSAEFEIPAAIGCGQQTFDRLVQAGIIELDCASRTVRPAR